MTREQAIKILNKEREYMKNHAGESQVEAFTMAIKALEQEPCEDAISRQAVLKTLDDMNNVLDVDRTVANYKELLKECYEVLPPVNPQEPKTGHWIKEKSVYGWDGKSYQCSKCCRSIHLDLEVEDLNDYPFCHCGAKMVEPQESEE